MKMENKNANDTKDTQQIIIQSNNYNVTVIPLDFSRNRQYNGQSQEYMEQYRNHDEYVQGDETGQQGALYSVSQRVPTVTNSFTSLCPTSETKSFSNVSGDWDRSSSTEPPKNTESTTEKPPKDGSTSSLSTTTAPGPSENLTLTKELLLQGPVIPMCIYLHSNVALMMEVEDTPTATTDLICQAIINCDELGLNKQVASNVFTLWMTSPLLGLQLKPNQKPYRIRQQWVTLLEKYSHVSTKRQQRDEPILRFQRNLFYPQHLEEKIKDQKILELLYEEAKNNILDGRYPCEVAHYIMLGGIQARIELGPYNPQVHSTHYFREEQAKFLPTHVRKSPTWTWLPISSKNSAEVRLLEQFKRIPTSATNRKLMKKYMEFCWSLPFYGSAFFEGQVEQPVRGLTSLLTHQDIPVLVGINAKGLFIIDDLECTILLGLRYEEFSWEYARPSLEDNSNCYPCLFLQFLVLENGARVSKILQVFSKQASLMDTLITTFVTQLKAKSGDETDNKSLENQLNNENEGNSVTQGLGNMGNFPSLSNKLSRLTLATFDEDGHCIGQMGSWSFSY